MDSTGTKMKREYREVIAAVDRASREIPFVRIVELGMIREGTKQYPVYHLSLKGTKSGNPEPRPVYISGGIHGDEPGGVWAVLEFLRRYRSLPDFYQRFDFTILPCTNPFGYEHGTRGNASGIDLNRQFKTASPPPEVRYVKNAVADHPFLLAMEFHEDVDTPGFYLYELTQDGAPPLGREIVSRIAGRFPINRNEEIEGLAADEGLIHRELGHADFRDMLERRSDWPPAFYHFHNGSRHCFTTETPVHLTRDERTEIHLTALDTALQKLWDF